MPHTHTMDLLRFSTAGSVDDGKSTLIGRLLYDSKSIFEDQVAAVEKTTKRRGGEGLDLALLTDGLIAEREQGITIDVAYRYFATPKRKFIIADTPGHEQYTRNMVTGASTANLAIILVDARKGLLPQSRRHAIIASLLGIPHLVVAVNKMDLVDWSEEVFEDIRDAFSEFATKLDVRDVQFIPMSALLGDNVVERSENMSWYQGPTLLSVLENVTIANDVNLHDFRFPVQFVSRPQTPELHDFRGYMGRIQSGSVRVGDEIAVLPSGLTTRVKEILTYDGPQEEAAAPQSVTLTLEDQIDISRGDMLVHADNQPQVAKQFVANLCWMNERALDPRKKYLIKHSTKTVRALVSELRFKLDIDTLDRVSGITELRMNEIGQVALKVQSPIMCDPYHDNRATGAFIVIDEDTNNTVGAGMICRETV